MKSWTKFLPFFFVAWYARRYLSKNTLGGRAGVWAYRDTFLTMPPRKPTSTRIRPKNY